MKATAEVLVTAGNEFALQQLAKVVAIEEHPTMRIRVVHVAGVNLIETKVHPSIRGLAFSESSDESHVIQLRTDPEVRIERP
jgi:hypothetical protein